MTRISDEAREQKWYRSLQALAGPHLMAFVPALMLCAFWFGGEAVMVVLAVVTPALFAASGIIPALNLSLRPRGPSRDGPTSRAYIERMLDTVIDARDSTGKTTAGMMLEIDNYTEVEASHGEASVAEVIHLVARRIKQTMRNDDHVAQLTGPHFACALAPMRHIDLEAMIQLAARIQSAVAKPVTIGTLTIHPTVSIGFCLPQRAQEQTGFAYLDAAERALIEARAQGHSAVHSYSGGGYARRPIAAATLDELTDALENGQIRPWFQPQVSTDTGQITGFEALARWVHPERGTIPPAEFLPAVREANLFERLGEVMLHQSLTALRNWEKAGHIVPRVAVNFSSAELGSPALADKIKWELDRFEFESDRLTIEILEDVISHSDEDILTRNVLALQEMGCHIDLDDFGTGHAAIANIRRFKVDRIKIDRSYITHVDRDREQQKMVAAILMMAERLGLDTLAEGVETSGEYSMLSQLGCGHIQGYSIARPMPYDETLAWMRSHLAALPEPPRVDRQAG